MDSEAGVGSMVRWWRRHRRRSQLDVALAADVSARHLSCIETGRAQPSRTMVERLCDELDVPLRQRNTLYLAAGFAPAHDERTLDDLGAARAALDTLLRAHDPNPAVAVDIRWDVVAANTAMTRFLSQVPPAVAGPPLNMMRATLHPDGLFPSLLDPAQWRANALRRLRRQLDRTGAPELVELLAELETYPQPPDNIDDSSSESDGIVTPMRMRTEAGDLSLLYTVTVFGSPRDVTLDELAVETFLPADRATRRLLEAMAADDPQLTAD
ncbi:MAG: helix-turn-helix transcriptional regulator [Rhodococcus sp.]|nr:helix-turn-helix transcriptional regulator [Rhodococcus sp. (in: high G+C Gram-positive bacteria)]